MEVEERKAYLPIGCVRLLDIRVILDDEEQVYEGKAEDASPDVKRLRYSEMKSEDKMLFYVYSEFNEFWKQRNGSGFRWRTIFIKRILKTKFGGLITQRK